MKSEGRNQGEQSWQLTMHEMLYSNTKTSSAASVTEQRPRWQHNNNKDTHTLKDWCAKPSVYILSCEAACKTPRYLHFLLYIASHPYLHVLPQNLTFTSCCTSCTKASYRCFSSTLVGLTEMETGWATHTPLSLAARWNACAPFVP